MSAHTPLEAGDPRRIGRYRIVGRLGRGGMGRVYLGLSPGGRAVAVKVVHAELAEDAGFRRRFVQEAAAARRVTGAFTAAVVDADPDGAPPWLATEYVPGMSLQAAVAAHGAWPQRSVLALGAALAEALEAVHRAGVVHRDLKPSNVLLAPDGPRLIDFGISLAAEGTRMTVTGAVVGTPGYMSPEQLRGGTAGPASDVFAFGAVLVHAATGNGPFGRGSAHALNYRVVHEEPDLSGVPSGLADVVARCLAKEPGDRPAVSDLVAELGRTAPDGGPRADAGWLPEAVTAVLTREYAVPRPGVRRRLMRAPGPILVAAATVVVAVSTAVLVPDRGSGAESGGPEPTPSPPKLTLLWSFPTPPGAGRPIVKDGRVYFAADGTLRALDADTGDQLWEYGRMGVPTSLTAVGDSLYFESGDALRDGYVNALDARTGKRRWVYEAGLTVFDGPIVVDETVYLSGADRSDDDRVRRLYAVDAGTGAKRWGHAAGRLFGGLTAADGTVYYTAVTLITENEAARHLRAVDARTGEQRWNVRLPGDMSNRTVSLTVADGVIYTVRGDGVVSARDLGGRLLWRQETDLDDFDDVESPTVAGGVVYLAGNGFNAGGEVVALDARTGKELWRHETEALSAPLTVADGTVYAGTAKGELHLLDARTGDSFGKLRLADGVDADATVAGGVVYFGDGGGRLRAAEITR